MCVGALETGFGAGDVDDCGMEDEKERCGFGVVVGMDAVVEGLREGLRIGFRVDRGGRVLRVRRRLMAAAMTLIWRVR